ncbi:MAG: dUTP diphosphatase [Ornithinimicrobium sp.]
MPVLLHLLSDEAHVPRRAHPGDAGLDIHANSEHTLAPGRRARVNTGMALALPAGYVAYVLPRSGLAARHGVTVLNAPGTVDAGYRGEIKVTLLNTDLDEAFTVRPGDRIAQLVIQPVHDVSFIRVDRLPGSARGENGHGSSGGYGDAGVGGCVPTSNMAPRTTRRPEFDVTRDED